MAQKAKRQTKTKPRASNRPAARRKISLTQRLSQSKLLLFVILFAIVGVAALVMSLAATFDKVLLLSANVPGASHEATPHGVPAGYDWQSKSTLHSLSPPSSDSGYINLWGQIYVDTTNIRPANTRVAVAGCQVWGLAKTSSSWTKLVDAPPGNLEGGVWSEDFQSYGSGFDIRTEPDGTQSMTNKSGYNAHWWTRQPLANVGSNYRAFITTCSTRLVLANPSLADDRDQSHYLLNLGIDWRKPDYGCPFVNGITICSGVGQGKMIKVAKNWRRAVFSTMSSSELASYPLPPDDAFRNPDGTYGNGDTLATSEPTPTPTPTPTPDPEPTPTPPLIGGGTGLTATYFNNKNFSGATAKRTDKSINFNWGQTAPVKKISSDTYSVRWTGKLQATKTEKYTLTTVSDDGVRLWLNDKLIINNWTDHSPASNSAVVDMVVGQKYNLKIEYYENTSSATMQLFWASPSIPQTIISTSQLFTK